MDFYQCPKITSISALPTTTTKLRFLFHRRAKAGGSKWSFVPYYSSPWLPSPGLNYEQCFLRTLLNNFCEQNLGGKKNDIFLPTWASHSLDSLYFASYTFLTIPAKLFWPVFCCISSRKTSSHVSFLPIGFWSKWLPCDASSMLNKRKMQSFTLSGFIYLFILVCGWELHSF